MPFPTTFTDSSVKPSSAPSFPEKTPAENAIRRILIVGAGGFGREILLWARDAWPSQSALIAGFLSADPGQPNGQACPLPILADPSRFEPEPGDALILAIGIPETRRAVAESLESRGAEFLTLIHPTAIVASTAAIGTGSIVCPYAIVSDSARVGNHTLLNYHASLGHDASTGDYAVLSPYATLGGGAASSVPASAAISKAGCLKNASIDAAS